MRIRPRASCAHVAVLLLLACAALALNTDYQDVAEVKLTGETFTDKVLMRLAKDTAVNGIVIEGCTFEQELKIEDDDIAPERAATLALTIRNTVFKTNVQVDAARFATIDIDTVTVELRRAAFTYGAITKRLNITNSKFLGDAVYVNAANGATENATIGITHSEFHHELTVYTTAGVQFYVADNTRAFGTSSRPWATFRLRNTPPRPPPVPAVVTILRNVVAVSHLALQFYGTLPGGSVYNVADNDFTVVSDSSGGVEAVLLDFGQTPGDDFVFSFQRNVLNVTHRARQTITMFKIGASFNLNENATMAIDRSNTLIAGRTSNGRAAVLFSAGQNSGLVTVTLEKLLAGRDDYGEFAVHATGLRVPAGRAANLNLDGMHLDYIWVILSCLSVDAERRGTFSLRNANVAYSAQIEGRTCFHTQQIEGSTLGAMRLAFDMQCGAVVIRGNTFTPPIDGRHFHQQAPSVIVHLNQAFCTDCVVEIANNEFVYLGFLGLTCVKLAAVKFSGTTRLRTTGNNVYAELNGPVNQDFTFCEMNTVSLLDTSTITVAGNTVNLTDAIRPLFIDVATVTFDNTSAVNVGFGTPYLPNELIGFPPEALFLQMASYAGGAVGRASWAALQLRNLYVPYGADDGQRRRRRILLQHDGGRLAGDNATVVAVRRLRAAVGARRLQSDALQLHRQELLQGIRGAPCRGRQPYCVPGRVHASGCCGHQLPSGLGLTLCQQRTPFSVSARVQRREHHRERHNIPA